MTTRKPSAKRTSPALRTFSVDGMPAYSDAPAPSAKAQAHTPTPWGLYVDSVRAKKNGRIVNIAKATVDMPHMRDDSTGRDMDKTKWDSITVQHAEAQANVAFIVNACNAYEADQRTIASMKEALEACAERFPLQSSMRLQIENALKLANGEAK